MHLRLLAAALLLTLPVRAEESPRRLFPDPPAPAGAAAPPNQPIEVQALPAPGEQPGGLAGAEAALGGPLWQRGAPAGFEELVARLPDAPVEPTLAQLQRNLLAAPGPAELPDKGHLVPRAERLLAMGAAETALELLAQDPGPAPPKRAALELRARLAAGRTAEACATVAALSTDASPWPEAAVVCAALAGDATAVELGLDRVAALDLPVDPALGGLARAAAADARFVLRRPLPGDPILQPLLRRVPIDVDPALITELDAAARRALAVNPSIASAARAAARGPVPLPPSTRPELSGAAPADWTAAVETVPREHRQRWAALVDGLGLEIPEPVWAALGREKSEGAAPAPDLVLWRGFETAWLAEQRGTVLLLTLLLLDGRPADAAPLTLRRALDALVALGLEQEASAVAAATGGALGL